MHPFQIISTFRFPSTPPCGGDRPFPERRPKFPFSIASAKFSRLNIFSKKKKWLEQKTNDRWKICTHFFWTISLLHLTFITFYKQTFLFPEVCPKWCRCFRSPSGRCSRTSVCLTSFFWPRKRSEKTCLKRRCCFIENMYCKQYMFKICL